MSSNVLTLTSATASNSFTGQGITDLKTALAYTAAFGTLVPAIMDGNNVGAFYFTFASANNSKIDLVVQYVGTVLPDNYITSITFTGDTGSFTLDQSSGLTTFLLTGISGATFKRWQWGRTATAFPSNNPCFTNGSHYTITINTNPPASTAVPNVVGNLLSVGEAAIVSAGLAVGAVTLGTDAVINAGFIISTTPAAATLVVPGSSVAILESQSITIPSVVGQDLGTAEANLASAGAAVGTVTLALSMTVPAGSIISQSFTGRGVTGQSIDLVESEGTGTGNVPNVINLSQAIAEATIIAAGFVVGTVSTEPDAIIIAGNVDVQTPVGGATAFLGSPVNITISTGLPPLLVPDLFGLTRTDAITLLQSLGLVVGAIGSAPSNLLPPGEVQTQNPSPGTPVAAGSIVSFVLSTAPLATGTAFDPSVTVISQYANSPTLLQLIANMNEYIDQSENFANFYNNVWNINTAVGFGLDIWGKIVGVSRLLQIPNTTDYVGFFIASESQPDQDWQPMGSDQPPQPAVGGAMYTGHNATTTYLLPDDAYRQLILAKAFANICTTTAPAINQILQNLYGPGTAFVLNDGPMAISYNLTFTPTAIQLAILEQSGVIPTPPGVSVTINTGV